MEYSDNSRGEYEECTDDSTVVTGKYRPLEDGCKSHQSVAACDCEANGRYKVLVLAGVMAKDKAVQDYGRYGDSTVVWQQWALTGVDQRESHVSHVVVSDTVDDIKFVGESVMAVLDMLH